MPEDRDIPKQPLTEEESADVIFQASSVSSSEAQPTDMEVHHHSWTVLLNWYGTMYPFAQKFEIQRERRPANSPKARKFTGSFWIKLPYFKIVFSKLCKSVQFLGFSDG